MSILLSLLLSQARVLPEIDRRALDLQARAEAVRNRRPATAAQAAQRAVTTATPQRRAVQQAATETRRPLQQAAVQTRRAVQPQMQPPATIRRASSGALDLSAITTICRAAGNQADPAGFLATLARAYSLDSREDQSLRTSCAAYLAGRADARVNHRAPAN